MIDTEIELVTLRVGERVLRLRAEGPPGSARGAASSGASSRLPVVLVLHGFKGFMHWGFFPELSRRIARRGWLCVSFNFSGSGIGADLLNFTEEEAFAKDTVSRQLEDVASVRTEIVRGGFPSADPSRMGLFGHSRGGGVALLHASQQPDLRALVTWAAIDDVDRFDEATKIEWRERGHITIPNARTGQLLRLDLDALEDIEAHRERLDIVAACGRLSVPTLLVHGSADDVVSFRGAQRLLAALPAGIGRLEAIEGAGHTFGARHPLEAAPPELERAFEATMEHFAAYLGD